MVTVTPELRPRIRPSGIRITAAPVPQDSGRAPAIVRGHGRHGLDSPDLAAATAAWLALAAHLTRSPLMRVARYTRRHGKLKLIYPVDEELTTTLPERPVALRLFTAGLCWVLGLDFDPKGFTYREVADQAAESAEFFRALGGRPIVDVAVGGGRHVWVPLSVPLTVAQARQLVDACQRRWPALDKGPMCNSDEGCLTAPGSVGKHGGFRRLVTPLDQAVEAVHHRAAADLLPHALTLLPAAPPPAVHVPALAPAPQDRPVRPLRPVHHEIAVHGTWPQGSTDHAGRPWTRSEPCRAVLCAAAFRQHRPQDVLARMATGEWNGLRALFEDRYGIHWERQFDAEWGRALQFVQSSTVPPQETRNTGGLGKRATEAAFVLRWLAAAGRATDHPPAGRARPTTYALLNALAWLAWRTGDRHVAAGTRSYSRACAGLLDHTTVAAILRHLRDLPEDQRPIRLISPGRGTHGDRYQLVIPPAWQHLTPDDPGTCPPRPISGVFAVRDQSTLRGRLLGITGWRLHQTLVGGTVGTATELARAAGISRAEAYTVLPALERLGLAHREQDGSRATTWRKGQSSAQRAGEHTGAQAHLAHLDRKHARERQAWKAALDRFAERRAAAINHLPENPDPMPLWQPGWAAQEPPDGPPPPTDAYPPRRTRLCPRPHDKTETAFLAIGDGARTWLANATRTGTSQVRAKMARAVEFAAILDTVRVNHALSLAAAASRFDEHDLGAILDHLATAGEPRDLLHVDEMTRPRRRDQGVPNFRTRPLRRSNVTTLGSPSERATRHGDQASAGWVRSSRTPKGGDRRWVGPGRSLQIGPLSAWR